MNKSFLGATVLSGLLIPAHIIGGGADIHLPMLDTDLAPEVKAAFSVIWHAISLTLILNTALLLGAATNQSWGRVAATIVAIQSAGFTILFMFYGLIRLGNLTELPQWTIFLVITGLTLVGLWRGAKPAKLAVQA